MGTTADKLNLLKETKAGIKAAINSPKLGDKFSDYPEAITAGKTAIAAAITEKGVVTTADVTFEQMAVNVRAIQSNSGTSHGTSWTKALDTTDRFQVLHHNDTAILAGGKNGLVRSTDGKTWSKLNLEDWINDICYGYGKDIWVVVGDVGIYYSTDNGVTWNKSLTPSGSVIPQVKYFDSGIFIACDKQGYLYYSLDGQTWSTSNLSFTNRGRVLFEYINGMYILIAPRDGIYYSADGKSWTKSLSTPGSHNPYIKYTYYNGLSIVPIFDPAAAATSMEQGIFYSSDYKTWTKATINFEPNHSGHTSIGFTCISKKDSMLFASANFGEGMYYSSDGKIWNKTNLSQINNKLTVYHFIYAQGIFVGSTLEGGIIYSYDGINWNTSNIANDAKYLYIFYHAGIWIAYGIYYTTSDTKMYSSSDGITWSSTGLLGSYRIDVFKNIVIAASDSSNGIYYLA